MNIMVPKIRMNVPEFLAWAEAQSDGKFELVDGEVIVMPPDRARHNIVKLNVAIAFRQAIKATRVPCTAYIDGISVVIDERTAYVPDVVVQAGTPVGLDDLIADQPLIVVEVLSPSTTRKDLKRKFADYFTVAAIAHYLVIDSKALTILHHRRGADGAIESMIHREGTLRLDPPGLSLSIADILALD